jgi:hypothetical protein
VRSPRFVDTSRIFTGNASETEGHVGYGGCGIGGESSCSFVLEVHVFTGISMSLRREDTRRRRSVISNDDEDRVLG